MKEILISIQPKWCELIASGKKTVEVRKTRPKIDTPFKCYIYCTKDKHGWFDFLNKTRRDGKVIGEFVCDIIQSYECEFVNDNCYEEIANVHIDEDGDEIGFIEWSNDSGVPYEKIELHKESCIQYNELKKYMGMGFGTFYGWHISDLVIYDKPKELSEFVVEGDCSCNDCNGCKWFERGNGYNVEDDCRLPYEYDFKSVKPLKRPFQSWGYVEGFGKLQSSKEKA